MIQKVEIICKPCHKCELLEERIHTIIRCLGFKYGVRIKYQFKFNKNIRDVEKFGYRVNQIPLVLINDNVEFVGFVKTEHLIRMKFDDILKGY